MLTWHKATIHLSLASGRHFIRRWLELEQVLITRGPCKRRIQRVCSGTAGNDHHHLCNNLEKLFGMLQKRRNVNRIGRGRGGGPRPLVSYRDPTDVAHTRRWAVSLYNMSHGGVSNEIHFLTNVATILCQPVVVNHFLEHNSILAFSFRKITLHSECRKQPSPLTCSGTVRLCDY